MELFSQTLKLEERYKGVNWDYFKKNGVMSYLGYLFIF